MPCLGVLIALMAPRFLIILLWLLTGWFKGVFAGILWPILGFFFMPTTLLWYSAVQNWWGGRWGFWQVIGLIIAIFIDISPSRAKRKRRRSKYDDAEVVGD